MRAIALCVLAGCGRIAFDPLAAGPVDAAELPPPLVMQTPALLIQTNQQPVLPIAPTGDGHLLVVITADIETVDGFVTGVTDDAGNTYVSADASYPHNGTSVGEIWYAAHSLAGATRVSIAAQEHQREIWFLEVAGATLRDQAAVITDAPQGAMSATPAITLARAPALVIATILAATSVQGLADGSAFVTLDALHGDQVAYQVVATPGTYSAVWLTPIIDVYSASTVAFTATP